MRDFSSDSNLSDTTTTHVSSSSDEDLGPEDSAIIELYQFEPVDGEHRDDSQTRRIGSRRSAAWEHRLVSCTSAIIFFKHNYCCEARMCEFPSTGGHVV